MSPHSVGVRIHWMGCFRVGQLRISSNPPDIRVESRGVHVDPELGLLDADGESIRLVDLPMDRYLVVQVVRYFGCLPCQDWLITLENRSDEFAARNARVAAIGGSADYQARWLREKRGVTMPLILDPEHRFRVAVEMAEPLGLHMADPRGIGAYLASLIHGNKPQRITSDTVRTPGVVILDREYQVRWWHEGTRIGDYPDHVDVLRELGKLS